MSTPLTPWAASLLELTETLSKIGADQDLQGEDWLAAALVAFIEAPFLHDLDPFLYRLLLTWAGFDLSRPEAVHLAASITAILGGGSFLTVHEDPDDPCLVWGLAISTRFESNWADGAAFGESDEGAIAYEVANQRAGRYFLDHVEALDRDQDHPEAA